MTQRTLLPPASSCRSRRLPTYPLAPVSRVMTFLLAFTIRLFAWKQDRVYDVHDSIGGGDVGRSEAGGDAVTAITI